MVTDFLDYKIPLHYENGQYLGRGLFLTLLSFCVSHLKKYRDKFTSVDALHLYSDLLKFQYVTRVKFSFV